MKTRTSFKLSTGSLIALQLALLTFMSNALAQVPSLKPQPNTVASQVPEVRVNGRVLTVSQLTQLEQIYHVRPTPGSYWYDALSGLYGSVGGPAAGLMYPGHKLGALPQDASAGNTLVVINHRRIPVSEWYVWSAIVGAPVQPGSYWLDARGNVGYEGIGIPFLNLHTFAARNAQGGNGNRNHRSVLSTWDLTGVAVFGGR